MYAKLLVCDSLQNNKFRPNIPKKKIMAKLKIIVERKLDELFLTIKSGTTLKTNTI